MTAALVHQGSRSLIVDIGLGLGTTVLTLKDREERMRRIMYLRSRRRE